MMRPIRCFFAIMIFSVLVQLTNATPMNFSVLKGEEETKLLRLAVEDHVSLKFTVVGKSDSTIDFSITNPHGELKAEYNRIGILSYAFVCDEAGEYVLHFNNTSMSEDKHVTLNYEIQHYILGIPQMLFLTIIIVLVCLGAIATFILMGKPH